MPKTIDNYNSKVLSQINESAGQKQAVSCKTIIICLIIIVFSCDAMVDAYRSIETKQPSQIEKSKLCLVEFKQKNCDPLNLNEHCSTLFSCAQTSKKDVLSFALSIS